MDAGTRRAFALDSRTVWVEQQIVGSTIIARDNLVLGPGEYNARVIERHVSTPSLGGSRSRAADFYPPFRSELSVKTPLGKGSPSRAQSPLKRGLNGSSVELRDFSTVCLDNGERQPFDPKNGFCPTPGSYLSHGSTLRVVKNDGVYETKSTVPFGGNIIPVPFGERCPTKKALPDYDVKYDSSQLRPTMKQGSFEKQSRIYIPSTEDMKQYNHRDSTSSREQSPPRKNIRYRPDTSSSSEKKMSVFQMRCSLVPMPKLKHRAPPVLVFDDSSYRNARTNKALDLNPKLVNQKARIHLYDKILAIPRKHHSMGVAAKLVVTSPSKGGGNYDDDERSESTTPPYR